MNTVTEEIAHAIVSLGNGQPGPWKVFTDWLVDSLAGQLHSSLSIKDETEHRWMDGRSQCLTDITSTIKNAHFIITSLKQKNDHQQSPISLLD